MKVCVISYNQVPIGNKAVGIEGTGLRYWRIANAIKSAGIEDVTLAIKDYSGNKKQDNGVNILGFSIEDDFQKLLAGYDAIIFSFAFGGFSRKIVENTSNTTMLICDAYSPYYIEALTASMDASQDKHILQQYIDRIKICNYVLLNSDYALVANDTQRTFYEGIISCLGGAGHYNFNRLLLLPGYVERTKRRVINPQAIISSRDERLTILWFGGMYPWFDSSKLIELFSEEAVSHKAKLVVVGGWNPMYSKTDLRFNGQYSKFYSDAKKYKLINRSIYFQDWVDYFNRIEIFNNADLAISINRPGPETKYSFRLRVADLAANGVVIITNGGDPLSDTLTKTGRALYYDFVELNKEKFIELINDSAQIQKAKSCLSSSISQEEIHIEKYITNLTDLIRSKDKPRIESRSDLSIMSELENSEKIYQSKLVLEQANTELLSSLEIAKKDLKFYQQELKITQNLYDELRGALRNPVRLAKIASKKVIRKAVGND